MTSSSHPVYRIHSVKVLTKLPHANEASTLLQRLVEATRALLIRRKWKVPLLSEFLPKSAGLLGLNLNGGSKIMIRLREHQNNEVFLPWESLLGTMVHELVHIEIGAHSCDFYQLVDQLLDEVQLDLLGREPSTPYVWSEEQGHKLGGSVRSQALPTLAAEAALKRQKTSSLLPAGGHRLGGSVRDLALLSRKELMARAAERRMADGVACGNVMALEDDPEAASLVEVNLSTIVPVCPPCYSVRETLIDLVGQKRSSSSFDAVVDLTGEAEEDEGL
eukprot:gene6805-7517_t